MLCQGRAEALTQMWCFSFWCTGYLLSYAYSRSTVWMAVEGWWDVGGVLQSVSCVIFSNTDRWSLNAFFFWTNLMFWHLHVNVSLFNTVTFGYLLRGAGVGEGGVLNLGGVKWGEKVEKYSDEIWNVFLFLFGGGWSTEGAHFQTTT